MKLKRGIAFLLLLCMVLVNCYNTVYAARGEVLYSNPNSTFAETNTKTEETEEAGHDNSFMEEPYEPLPILG